MISENIQQDHNVNLLKVDSMDNNNKITDNRHYISKNTSPSQVPHDQKQSDFNEKFKQLAEPLLDLKLVAETIEQWSRPLPPRYLSRPLVFVGPSGVGKGRLVSALLADYAKFFKKVTTHTTRNPRPDEIHRKSYHFVTNQTFHEMVANNSFIEYAQVHNNFYGTTVQSFSQIQKEGKISIMEIDIQGAKSIKNVSKSIDIFPMYLFVKPPDVNLLRGRLLVRGTETEEEINLRLRNALIEVSQADEKGLFDAIIVNDDFEKATHLFFRLVRDWYPALPSAARIRMLQRRIKHIKALSVANNNSNNNSNNNNSNNNDDHNNNKTTTININSNSHHNTYNNNNNNNNDNNNNVNNSIGERVGDNPFPETNTNIDMSNNDTIIKHVDADN